jgi:aerobic-type carbon monoxide dehydrogenase small subunit (CoxS/CutS family)
MAHMTLRVNGAAHEVEAEPDTPLLLVLRNQLGLTGAKLGCGLEQCGACAVLVDGEAILSCVRPAADFEGRAIVTAEGLAADGQLNEIQRAFVAEGAAQCGYCTPGMVIALTALFGRTANPDQAAVRAALRDHLCRCGSHVAVLRATRRLAQERV